MIFEYFKELKNRKQKKNFLKAILSCDKFDKQILRSICDYNDFTFKSRISHDKQLETVGFSVPSKYSKTVKKLEDYEIKDFYIEKDDINVAYLIKDNADEFQMLIHEIETGKLDLKTLIDVYKTEEQKFNGKVIPRLSSKCALVIWAHESEIKHIMANLDLKTEKYIQKGIIKLAPFGLLKKLNHKKFRPGICASPRFGFIPHLESLLKENEECE